jgi:hypothetical protein
VATVQLDHPLPGELPEPREERERPVAQVRIEAGRRRHQRVLDDVGRVEPRQQPPVEPDGDDPPETGPMPLQEPLPGVVVAPTGPLDESLGVQVARRSHRDASLP